MVRLILRTFLSNAINLVLVMLLMTSLVRISGHFLKFPRGLQNLVANRQASNVGQVLFLTAIMIGGLLSGYLCLHLVGAGPVLSGVLPCIGVAGSLLLHQLLTGSSVVDDVPKFFKVGCCMLTFLLGITGAYGRLKTSRLRT